MKRSILTAAVIMLQIFAALDLYAADKKVIVGVYQNEPIIFKDTDQRVKGIYADLLNFIAREEGWEIEYRFGSWQECLKRLETGEIDLLTAIAYTDERRERFDFNSETVVTNWGQIYCSADSGIQSFLDLNGKRVAVVRGDVYYQFFKEVEDKFDIKPVFVEYREYIEIFKALDGQSVQAGIVPRIFGSYHEKAYKVVKTHMNFRPVELKFAAARGHQQEILAALDRHLVKLKADKNSVYYRSLNRWIEGVNKLVFPKWLKPIWVICGIAGILLLLLVITYILKWQVRVRTEALRDTIAAKEKIESELRIAHQIQMELLPTTFPPFPDRTDFDIYAAIEPARAVGGDFYDFFLIGDQHLCFMVGDVSDKGVPAALFMAKTKTLIKAAAVGTYDSGKILQAVNKEVCFNNDSFMFVTLFIGILNTESGRLCYTNAGHNPPLMISNGDIPQYVEGTGSTALGIDADSNFSSAVLHLGYGDTLFLYTDGVTEAQNENNEFFAAERLFREVAAHAKDPLEKFVLTIMNKVKEFSTGTTQADDITILAIKKLNRMVG